MPRRLSACRRPGLVAVTITAVFLGLTGTAHARPPAGSSTGSGTCSASPSPPTVGHSYAIVGARLPANSMVDVIVTDSSGGTSSNTASTDASGAVSVVEQAWVSGSASAKITDTSRQRNVLASCTYSIG